MSNSVPGFPAGHWLSKAAVKTPRLMYQPPNEPYCLGFKQRTAVKISENYNRREAERLRTEATHTVEFMMIDTLDMIPGRIDWLLQGSRPEDYRVEQHQPEEISVDEVTYGDAVLDDASAEEGEWKEEPKKGFRHLIGIQKHIRVGISTIQDTLRGSQTFFKPTYICLSSVCRSICIDVKACFTTGVQDQALRDFYLRPLLDVLSERGGVTLHGYHAGAVAARLHLLGLRCHLKDMSMAVCDHDQRDLVQVCKTLLQHTDLITELDPVFVAPQFMKDSHNHMIVSLREAYFCAALAHVPMIKSVIASTLSGRSDDYVRAVDALIGTIEVPQQRQDTMEPVAFNKAKSGVVEFKYNQEIGMEEPEYYKLSFNREQNVPLPSKRDVMVFHLAYKYYTEQDNEHGQRGPMKLGVWSEMYGQVFRVQGREAHVHFPQGIRLGRGYNEIPHKVFTDVKLNQTPPATLEVFKVPDPSKDKRLEILGISTIGLPEPSAEDLRKYRTATLLLHPTGNVKGFDRSNVAGFLVPSFGGDME